MRVLYIHCFYQYKGGEDTVVHEEIELLNSRGIITDVLSFSNEGSTLGKIISMPFNVGSYRKTLQRIKLFKPDIIHIHNLHFAASPSVVYAIKKSKVPFVITLHNFRLICPSALLFYKGKSFYSSLDQIFPWKAVRYKVYRDSFFLTFWLSFTIKLHQWAGTWSNCATFIVLNNYSKKIFETYLITHSRFVIKPNFSSVQKQQLVTGSSEYLYVGRLSEEKGIEILLNVFADNGLSLNIAGDGPFKEAVIDYSRRFPNINYLGLINKEDVLNLMRRCSALIFPSVWPEGMPLTIIEALACGAPVITSRSGAMIDMITDNYNGLYFTTGAEADLKEKINTWQKMSAEQKIEFKHNALKTFNQKYSSEQNFDELISIYNNVLPATGRLNINRTNVKSLSSVV